MDQNRQEIEAGKQQQEIEASRKLKLEIEASKDFNQTARKHAA